MIRMLLLLAALLFVGAASVQLTRDTRLALRAGEPLARTLEVPARSGASILLVLQEQDCSGADALVERWDGNRPADARLEVLVVGGSANVDRLRKRLAGFPDVEVRAISHDDGALAGAKLGYRQTPFAVFFDNRGRVAGSSPGSRNLPPRVLRDLMIVPS
ncbi:MAG TPA: hypothetical protein VHG08_02260 [Longimicrobium sp.]|nr:hypothetical protein [Longimicrobium sp.]